MTAVVSSKQRCYGMIEDCFPNGLHEIVSPVTFPGMSVSFYPFPDNIRDVWGDAATRMRAYIRNYPTRFSTKVSTEEGIHFATSLVEAEEDKEVKTILRMAMTAWKEDFASGVFRGTFDPYMYLARAILADPCHYPKSTIPYRYFHPLPDITPYPSFDYLDIPGSGNVGFWELKSWNDPRRSPTENVEFHDKVFQSCFAWKERVLSLPDITPKLVGAISPPLAGFHRSQGRGRIVFALAKMLALWMMLVTQPLQSALDSAGTVWYAGGDRANRMKQMLAVLNGLLGIHSVDGDDFIVKAGDGIVSGDTSSFDGGVTKSEHLLWIGMIRKIVEKEIFILYKAAFFGGLAVDVATSIGMLKRVLLHGVVSGMPDTHLEDTWIQSMRIMNSNWRTAELGLSMLNTFGIYRHDRQFVLDYTATMAQLIVSDAYPHAIFGLIPRVVRALFEREGRSAWDTNAMEDARIVQVLSNLYGTHWAHEQLCAWVRKYWSVRISENNVVSILRMSKKFNPHGAYERKALSETYRLLAV